MVDAVVSTKYGKRPVLDVPALKAYGGNVHRTSNVQYTNQGSGMMDYNTSSLIQQPQQQVAFIQPQQQQQQAQQQYVQQQQQQRTQQLPTYSSAPVQTQYPTVPQQSQPPPSYQPPPPQPSMSAYNPYAASGFPDNRMAASAPMGGVDPNNFLATMMGPLNPFNPANMLAAPLAPPPVPHMAYPAPLQHPPPPPAYPPPPFSRSHTFSQPTYGPPPHYRYPPMNQPVHTSPDENYSIEGKLEYGKMTTVHVDSITGNFKQLPDVLRRELRKTYGKYAETDIKITVENGEYHIYASPHREDDRPIRGPRAYDEEDRKPYDHDDFKRQPRYDDDFRRQPRYDDDFRPRPPRQYDSDFVKGRGFEQRRPGPRDSGVDDGEWVLVKRR